MDNQDTNRPERRTAFVARELKQFDIDIAALSETRRAEEGSLREEGGGYTFYWKGKDLDQPRIHGVGFAIKNELVKQITEQPVGINERLMTMRLQLSQSKHLTLISAYAPTLDKEDEIKEGFYNDLDQAIATSPPDDKLVLLGDFNARVGREHQIWEGTIGRNGVGKCNSNGTLLLSKCAEHELIITNTIFRQKNKNKTSWQHPRSKHWHLIDYIIVRQKDKKDVLITKAETSADDCWTDHRLISSVMRIKIEPRKKSHKKPLNRKYNTGCLLNKDIARNFETALINKLPVSNSVNIEEHWNQIKTAVKETCNEVIGFKKKQNNDWFDLNDHELTMLIDKKREAYIKLRNNPTSTHLKEDHRRIKTELQRIVRHKKNEYWRSKAEEIQSMADQNNSRAFFQATKEIYGPTVLGQVPLKSKDGSRLLKTKAEISDRWQEHFSELLNQDTTYDREILQVLPQHQVDDSMNRIPSLEEVKNAIHKMKSNKSAGPDGIPTEIYKYGGNLLQYQLHLLIVKIWTTESIPLELINADIVKIYKRKGDRGECGNYRGISLLSTAGKVLSGVINERLKPLAEKVLPETQCGFRCNRGTSDMIFTIRQLQEKCREQNKPLYMGFIDLTKAFDTVSRELLWEVLAKYGCPLKFIRMVKLMHVGMMATVLDNDGGSEPFEVRTGVKQGCLKAATLFSIFIAVVMFIVAPRIPNQIEIRYRIDGKIFNLSRLKAKSKTSKTTIVEVQYADDNGVAALNEADLQTILNAFDYAYSKLGLKINTKKTEVIFQPAPDDNTRTPPNIILRDNVLKNVETFSYLGSIVSIHADIDAEIDQRLQKAAAAFGKLRKRVFEDPDIRTTTKIKVYRAIVLTSLLYASETWTTYRKHLKKLERFHQRCLRKLLNIKWQDYISNLSVLERAGLTSIEAVIVKN